MNRLKMVGGLLALLLVAVAFTASASGAPPGVPVLNPNDPGYQQYKAVYQQVDAPAAWAAEQGTTCSAGIAVLDTWASDTSDLSVTRAGDYGSMTGDIPHGTNMASVAGAKINNGIGIPGMSNCPVTSVRVVNSDGTWGENALYAGIQFACQLSRIRVLSISLWQTAGQPNMADVSAALQACMTKGILPVLIAGNGTNEDLKGTSVATANPLASGNPQTLRVCGVDANNQIDPQSNFGSALCDIAAPYSIPVDNPDGSWAVASGTSPIAPMVAAVAAEVFNQDPNLTAAQAKQLLMASGTPVSGLPVTSGRVLDYYNALVAAGYKPPAPVSLRVARKGRVKITDNQGHINCGKKCAYALYAPQGKVVLRAHVRNHRKWVVTWHGACHGHKLVCKLSLAKPGAALHTKVVAVHKK